MMTTGSPQAASSGIGKALRRWRQRARLWGDRDYRRSSYLLLIRTLRGAASFRFGVALLLSLAAGAYLAVEEVAAPEDAFRLVVALAAAVAYIASAGLFASELRQGTLELLWLAEGSAKSLVRRRVVILTVSVAVLVLPIAGIACWYVYEAVPPGLLALLAVYIVSVALFTISMNAACGGYLRQPWAGSLLAAVILGGIVVIGRDSMSAFYPFALPLQLEEGARVELARRFEPVSISKAFWSRVLIVVYSLLLLRPAIRNLRRTFR